MAEHLIECLLSEQYYLYAKYAIPSEINRMMGDLYGDISTSALQKAFLGFCDYAKTLTDATEKMLVYYSIPRLVNGAKYLKEDVMQFLWNALPNEKGLPEIAILNWLTQLGDMRAEALYFSRIVEDEVFSQYNRGAYLFYQQDRPDEIYVSADEGKEVEWQATALAFVEHFKSVEIRQKCIRRPDLAIMLSFVRSGKRVYPFFASYFGHMTEEQVITLSFDDKYIALLEKQNVDVEARKQETAALLQELKREIFMRFTDVF